MCFILFVCALYGSEGQMKKCDQKKYIFTSDKLKKLNSKIILGRGSKIILLTLEVLNILLVQFSIHFLLSFNFKIFQNTVLRIICLSYYSDHNYFHFWNLSFIGIVRVLDFYGSLFGNYSKLTYK